VNARAAVLLRIEADVPTLSAFLVAAWLLPSWLGPGPLGALSFRHRSSAPVELTMVIGQIGIVILLVWRAIRMRRRGSARRRRREMVRAARKASTD
jgi:hypothetical protein